MQMQPNKFSLRKKKKFVLHANLEDINLEGIIKIWDEILLAYIKNLRLISELEDKKSDLFYPKAEILNLLEDTGDFWS